MMLSSWDDDGLIAEFVFYRGEVQLLFDLRDICTVLFDTTEASYDGGVT